MSSKRKLDLEIHNYSNKKLKIEKCLKRKFIIAFDKEVEILAFQSNKKFKIRDENAKYISWRRDILLYL